jgi:hypothetical protein
VPTEEQAVKYFENTVKIAQYITNYMYLNKKDLFSPGEEEYKRRRTGEERDKGENLFNLTLIC